MDVISSIDTETMTMLPMDMSRLSKLRMIDSDDEQYRALVAHWFALMLLILYGRLAKKLANHGGTVYQRLELTQYSIIWCTPDDNYFLPKLWELMKNHVLFLAEKFPIKIELKPRKTTLEEDRDKARERYVKMLQSMTPPKSADIE